MKSSHYPVLVAALVLPALAGEPVPPPEISSVPESSSGWEFTGTLYAPLMGLEGDVGVGPVSTPLDLSFGDILEELDGGITAAFEARRERWSLTGDFIWLKLSASAQPTANSYLGFRQEEIIASLALGYELYGSDSTSIDLLAGAAYTGMDVDLEPFTPRLPTTLRAGSGSQDWIDPFVGLRVRQHLGGRWSVWARGDYGGFGVSSDEYWQLIAGISCRLSQHTSLALAYRMIGVDYQQGTFTYDTEMSGPNLGLVFRF